MTSQTNHHSGKTGHHSGKTGHHSSANSPHTNGSSCNPELLQAHDSESDKHLVWECLTGPQGGTAQADAMVTEYARMKKKADSSGHAYEDFCDLMTQKNIKTATNDGLAYLRHVDAYADGLCDNYKPKMASREVIDQVCSRKNVVREEGGLGVAVIVLVVIVILMILLCVGMYYVGRKSKKVPSSESLEALTDSTAAQAAAPLAAPPATQDLAQAASTPVSAATLALRKFHTTPEGLIHSSAVGKKFVNANDVSTPPATDGKILTNLSDASQSAGTNPYATVPAAAPVMNAGSQIASTPFSSFNSRDRYSCF